MSLWLDIAANLPDHPSCRVRLRHVPSINHVVVSIELEPNNFEAAFRFPVDYFLFFSGIRLPNHRLAGTGLFLERAKGDGIRNAKMEPQ